MAKPYLKQDIIAIIEQQLELGDPPETREAFQRLLAAGHSRQRVAELLGSALIPEIWWKLQKQRLFDREHVRTLLNQVRERAAR